MMTLYLSADILEQGQGRSGLLRITLEIQQRQSANDLGREPRDDLLPQIDIRLAESARKVLWTLISGRSLADELGEFDSLLRELVGEPLEDLPFSRPEEESHLSRSPLGDVIALKAVGSEIAHE